ncbi:AraC family transcriptional regulator [uncultured Pelagimonas sp.]|uniref:helix-turn-helix domain-containing protein n=1 Tax=uncultured Pelagimonas sp. TaxID=1618102 RepID=UPI002621DFB9|nr:AraC family transcriptional regulator [uncultured Pelagimonas sp.]
MPVPQGYQETDPLPASGAETFWTYVASEVGQTLILPDGRCDVIYHGRLQGDVIVDATPVLTGPATTSFPVTYQPGDVWVGVRLQPWMALSVWGAGLAGARDQVLRGPDATAALPALTPQNQPETIADLQTALEALENKLERAGRGDLPENALSLIRFSGGQIAIHDLAAQLGLSERQLNRRFAAQVGLPPKLYASIIRFHRALRLIRDLGLSASEAAYEAGYSDQAHLIRSFRRFGGFSPAHIPTAMSLPGFSKLA